VDAKIFVRRADVDCVNLQSRLPEYLHSAVSICHVRRGSYACNDPLTFGILLARNLRRRIVMSIGIASSSRRPLCILMASAMITVLGCNRYPSSPRDVVIRFVKETQEEKSDAKSYLSTSLKGSYSGKGFKYTFGDAEVLQSVPEANQKYAVLVKRVRLGGGGVVTATDMRVNVTKENGHWVIARLVAGVTDPGGSGNNDWLNADGISVY